MGTIQLHFIGWSFFHVEFVVVVGVRGGVGADPRQQVGRNRYQELPRRYRQGRISTPDTTQMYIARFILIV